METNVIAAIVGMIVSALLEIIPGLRDIWNDIKWKPLFLFLAFECVTIAALALGCSSLIEPTAWTCDPAGLLKALVAGFVAFMGSQTAYGSATRKLPNAVNRARA